MGKISILLFIMLCIPMVHAQTIEGTDFVLTSPDGRVTARLTTSGEGTPGLFFYDTQDVVRVSIGLYASGAPTIVLNDDKGRASAIMRLVQNNGDPVLVLKENGQDRVIINKDGLPTKSVEVDQVVKPSTTPAIIAGFVAGLISGLIGAAFIVKRTREQ